jgi:hypothetical protein
MHTIPSDLLQAIAAYLETRPYREVAGLLAAMQEHCKPVEPKADKP